MVRILVPIHRPIEEMVGRASRSWNFSKEVNDVFAAAKDVDSSAAARLQENLASNPDDLNTRLELLAYSRTATEPGVASIRLRQLLWLATNQPKHEVLGAPFATPGPRTPADAELYEQLRRVWLKQLADDPRDPTLLAHALETIARRWRTDRPRRKIILAWPETIASGRRSELFEIVVKSPLGRPEPDGVLGQWPNRIQTHPL